MTNAWNEVLSPFYSESSLYMHGIDETEGLIALHTNDGSTVYPHGQFDVLADKSLRRRDDVLGLWNTLIQPAIDEGVVDEWTATGLLLQSTDERLSEAEIIAADDSQVDRVAQKISRTISRWRQ